MEGSVFAGSFWTGRRRLMEEGVEKRGLGPLALLGTSSMLLLPAPVVTGPASSTRPANCSAAIIMIGHERLQLERARLD